MTQTERVFELRVHGVGSDTPSDSLGAPDVEQVAGDGAAGFYRRGTDQDERDVVVEAYSWRNLHAGGPARALWLLLLPFAATNLAGWMSHNRPGDSRRDIADGVTRALAVVLTGWLTVGLAALSMDVIAYQQLSSLAPLRRVVIGAAVPIGVLALLGALVVRTSHSFDRWQPVGRVDEDTLYTPEDLADEGFWTSPGMTLRLNRLHVAFGLGVVAAVVSLAGLHSSDGAAVWWGLAVASGVVVTAGLAIVGSAKWVRSPAGARAVLGWAVAVVTATLLTAVIDAPGPPTVTGPLPGFDLVIDVAGWTAGLALATLIGVWLATQVQTAAWRSSGPVVAAGIGLITLGSFLGGVVVRVAEALGSSIVYPAVFVWLAVIFTSASALILATAALWWLPLYFVQRARLRASVRADYPPAARAGIDHSRDEGWVSGLAQVRFLAALGELATWLSQAWAYVAVVALLGVGVAGAVVGLGPPSGSLSWLATGSTWVAVAVPLVAIASVQMSYRRPDARHSLAQVWDGANIWPRRYHPFAPPAYAERAVPELAERIAHLHGKGGVVVAAHSQGSVLAYAALAQLRRRLEPGDRLVLVTYGSPIVRFYLSSYPGMVSPDDLDDMAGWLTWVSFWRDTDPVGGPVIESGDVRLLDPETAVQLPGEPVPRPRGHSRYERDRIFRDRVEGLGRFLLHRTKDRPD